MGFEPYRQETDSSEFLFKIIHDISQGFFQTITIGVESDV